MIVIGEVLDRALSARVDLAEEDAFQLAGLHAIEPGRVEIIGRETVAGAGASKRLASASNAFAVAEGLRLEIQQLRLAGELPGRDEPPLMPPAGCSGYCGTQTTSPTSVRRRSDHGSRPTARSLPRLGTARSRRAGWLLRTAT